jgi:hypothetical protein
MSPEPVTHELKTWPTYFERLLREEKTFEVRRNDRGFQAGDQVRLREYNPAGTHDNCGELGCAQRRYSGRELRFEVPYVYTGPGVESGFAVLSLKLVSRGC